MRMLLALLVILATTGAAMAEGKLVDAFSGRMTQFYYAYALETNCMPLPNGRIMFDFPRAPLHGKLYASNTMVPTDYPPSNPRHICNGAARPGLRFLYRSTPGYTGPDHVTMVLTFPRGGTLTVDRPIQVHN